MGDTVCSSLSFVELKRMVDGIKPVDGLPVNLEHQRATMISHTVHELNLTERRRLVCEGLTYMIEHEIERHTVPDDHGELITRLRSARTCISSARTSGSGHELYLDAGIAPAIAVIKHELLVVDLTELDDHRKDVLHNHLRSLLHLLFK